jgi:radical SAM protein with 4Fe4S-binding SPASM domain
MLPEMIGKNATKTCAHPFNCVYVTCEGYLSPCALDCYLNLKVGDLNKTSLKDAWYGDDMKNFRQRFLDGFNGLHPQCKACYTSESILANILDIEMTD